MFVMFQLLTSRTCQPVLMMYQNGSRIILILFLLSGQTLITLASIQYLLYRYVWKCKKKARIPDKSMIGCTS
ncbi:peroxisome assembly protein 12 [Biomphalaria glabrata]|nr:peroxisome assembly protein 12 [Biomphalaria glabrata]